MKTKIILFLSGCLAIGFSSQAQVRFTPSDPFTSYSIGVNVGYTTLYSGLSQSDAKPAYMLNLAKHINPNVSVGLELQHGTISGTEPANVWTSGLKSTNQFNAVNINGKVSLGEFFHNPQNVTLRTLSNLYVGAGVGLIDNDITSITDKFNPNDTKTIDYAIKKTSLAAVIPLNVGLNVYLKNFITSNGAVLNVNYQMNATFSGYIDGYKFPASKWNDAYSILSVGISFYLGHIDRY